MPPHPKRTKLSVNGASANATAAAAAAGVAADRVGIAEQPNSNAADGIIDGLLDDDSADNDPTINGMSNNMTATILGFLGYKDIMRSRICCRKFRDAARATIVSWAEYGTGSYSLSSYESHFLVKSVQKHKAMVVMTTALPNLQQISLSRIGTKHKYCDGKDPDEEEARCTANCTTHDIQVISTFSKLRSLTMYNAPLNGKYPVLFNFPLLQILEIKYCSYLKWDLNALAGLPSLKELNAVSNDSLTGNITSLSVLKDTLEMVYIRNCKIEGDFMDLAAFPRLKSLNLTKCSLMTGDMRKIGENDFPMLEELGLDADFIGAKYHQFLRISDVASVAEAIYRLKQRDPPLIRNLDFIYWSLSRDSPEWYDQNGENGHPPPPFSIDFVRAGSRDGWRWRALYTHNRVTNSCEINWLDPEPDRESNDYDVYIRELQSIQEDIFCYEGYHQPPTEEEYKRVCEEYYGI
eukprot:scaffold28851_cov72-Skeletonema_dohrnii-CCMP3373.AAC.1